MAKKIKLDPTPAVIVPVESRDVKAEQVSQQQTLDYHQQMADEQANREKETARIQAENFKRATEAAAEQQQLEQANEKLRPLTDEERRRLEQYEADAMKSGNRPVEIMRELAVLRIRSKVPATSQTITV